MPVKNLRSESEMSESLQTAKRSTEMANIFWKGLNDLGVVPDDISVDGPEVRLLREGCERRLPVGVLSSGISVLAQKGLKRDPSDWPFERQIGYLAWKGRRA